MSAEDKFRAGGCWLMVVAIAVLAVGIMLPLLISTVRELWQTALS